MTRPPAHRIIPSGIPFAQIPHDVCLDPDVTNSAYRVYGFLMKLANTEGRAWPGHRYIAEHLPMSRPTVQTAIANLESAGWVTVNRGAQAHTYIVHGSLDRLPLDYDRPRNFTGQETAPVKELDQPGQETLPEPVKELGLTDNHDRHPETDTQNARRRNETWDTLVELFGEPSPTRRKLYGRVTKYLDDQDANPDEIRRRAARIVTDWGPEKLTITSLETHWSRFDGHAGQVTSAMITAAEKQQASDDLIRRLETP